jgi:eukaryotic-like serine/threonine-protein kinase
MTRIAWSASSTEEETRAYLQERLRVLSGLMFWAFTVFLGGLSVMYWAYPHVKPRYNNIVFLASTVGLLNLAAIWRLFLERKKLSMRDLNRIDAFYAVGTGLLFGLGGYLGTDFVAAPYATLLYAVLTVLSRAIVVPSTPQRTLVMAALCFGPFCAASVLVCYVPIAKPFTDMPPIALFLAVLIIAVSTAVLAAIGSQTTYSLARSAQEARQLGQYTLDQKIGGGGMGDVYIAHHVLLRRPTAIKLLRPDRISSDDLDRFEREVMHTSKLTHPNTVAVFDYGRSPDGVFYYAMEYLDGINLQHLVERYGPQSAGRVVQILAQVASALTEAHARGLIHRDIKPANIILCERGGIPDVAKVVDFGLVKQLSAEHGETRQMVVGTAKYLAPERVTAPDRVGPAVDLYALGATGYFLLTGKPVFDGPNAIAVCADHVSKQPIDIREIANVPDAVADLIMTCLDKAPERRPTAAELVRSFRALDTETWDDAQARAWWEEFRAAQRAIPSHTDETRSITIDLEQRSADAA